MEGRPAEPPWIVESKNPGKPAKVMSKSGPSKRRSLLRLLLPASSDKHRRPKPLGSASQYPQETNVENAGGDDAAILDALIQHGVHDGTPPTGAW